MNSVINFISSIARSVQTALGFLVTIPGLITAAIGSFFALLASIFNINFFTTAFTSLFSDITSLLTQVVSFCSYNSSGDFASCLRYIVAFDSLVGDMLVCFTVTFGVLSLVFFGFVLSIVGLLGSLFVIRGIQKLISIFSAGYVKT